MPFCNYKLWFVDVKRWTWYLCIGDQFFKGWLATKAHYHWPFWSKKYFNGQTLAKNLIELLDTYELKRKIVTSIKDEGFNVNTMITSLKSIISCDVLGLEKNIQGTSFDRAIFKTCQYATIDEKVCKNFKHYEKLCPPKNTLPYN